MIKDLRTSYAKFPLRKPDASVHRDLTRGWLIPYLLQCDELTWNRWDYWYKIASQPDGEHALPPEPIPKIEFIEHQGAGPGAIRTRKLLEHCLDQVAPYWTGWGSSEYISYFLDWLLFGFGDLAEAPREPTPGASDRLYQVFDLGPLLLWPHDYLGDMLAEMKIGQRAGFYPTPHTVAHAMTEILIGDGKDHRAESMCDPAIGTGRMALHASNYCLCLSGQDINPLMVKASLVNAFLYAPWMARPIRWVWDLSANGGLAREVPPDPEDTEDQSPQIVPAGITLSRRGRRLVKQGQRSLL